MELNSGATKPLDNNKFISDSYNVPPKGFCGGRGGRERGFHMGKKILRSK